MGGAGASSHGQGRLAQLVRAPRLHRGCRGFESLIAHPPIPSHAAIPAKVAQLVEHATENRSVRSSTLRLGTTQQSSNTRRPLSINGRYHFPTHYGSDESFPPCRSPIAARGRGDLSTPTRVGGLFPLVKCFSPGPMRPNILRIALSRRAAYPSHHRPFFRQEAGRLGSPPYAPATNTPPSPQNLTLFLQCPHRYFVLAGHTALSDERGAHGTRATARLSPGSGK